MFITKVSIHLNLSFSFTSHKIKIKNEGDLNIILKEMTYFLLTLSKQIQMFFCFIIFTLVFSTDFYVMVLEMSGHFYLIFDICM